MYLQTCPITVHTAAYNFGNHNSTYLPSITHSENNVAKYKIKFVFVAIVVECKYESWVTMPAASKPGFMQGNWSKNHLF